jgi:hypothetical protein
MGRHRHQQPTEPFRSPSRRHEIVLYGIAIVVVAAALVTVFFAGTTVGARFCHG